MKYLHKIFNEAETNKKMSKVDFLLFLSILNINKSYIQSKKLFNEQNISAVDGSEIIQLNTNNKICFDEILNS